VQNLRRVAARSQVETACPFYVIIPTVGLGSKLSGRVIPHGVRHMFSRMMVLQKTNLHQKFTSHET
jgi:hypothetical protein